MVETTITARREPRRALEGALSEFHLPHNPVAATLDALEHSDTIDHETVIEALAAVDLVVVAKAPENWIGVGYDGETVRTSRTSSEVREHALDDPYVASLFEAWNVELVESDYRVYTSEVA